MATNQKEKIGKDIDALIKTGRSKSSKSILVVSDMHVGAKSALCSDDPETDGGYKPSANQKKLFQEWNRTLDEVTQNPTAFVINGEPIDGSNPKSQGDGLWSNDFNEQMNDSAKLIK